MIKVNIRRTSVAVALVALTLLGYAIFQPGSLDGARDASARGDQATAMRLYQSLANEGNSEAQYQLGTYYLLGTYIPKDYSEAVKWFRKAADQGSTNAQELLALRYERGEGVPLDYVEAHKWYSLAASGTHLPGRNISSSAIKSRDRTANMMTAQQVDEAQKLAREWKPAPPRGVWRRIFGE